MGSRGRSIRLRIYFLVAIPLVTMLGLFADVAYTSVTNFVVLDRAPALINATAVPLANFMNLLQAERRAAVVYSSAPTSDNRGAYESAITATRQGVPALVAALNVPAGKSAANEAETQAIQKFLGTVTGAPLGNTRQAVLARALPGPLAPPMAALEGYTQVIMGIPAVFQAEASGVIDATAAVQGLGLISTVTAREELSIQDAVLAGALTSGALTQDSRVAFVEAAGRQQDDEILFQNTLSASELNAYNTAYNRLAPKAVQDQLTQVKRGVEAGLPLSVLEKGGLSAPTWKFLVKTVEDANFQGGLSGAAAVLAHDQQVADNARNKVIITGALGALGLILTLIVTILLARSINRRLTTLRRSALALAQEHLPSVVARLRRGEEVDLAAEAPPLRVGNDEIGQVGQAFDAVRQTAIASAVEEARLRQGVNDVFRNLARRNQSLLQRQLTSLDQMERRATDPEVLDDLFKLDHLTTRMRRHAEGLIILSGAPPGRGWSAPVRLVDVMRGAVAEVEDYARVQVATQAKAALSGSAVTDVIHLIAELIENATSLSPPYTQVRVTGEIVSNGFAIEVEDRGLGMTPERMAELNQRLSSPPEVNPANTEQLGLFVVAHLARRHGIGVMLRPSPYGGTTAVVLIPRQLVVDERPAALTSGDGGAGRGMGATAADGPAYRSTGASAGFTGAGYPAADARTDSFPGSYPANGGYPAGGNGHAAATGNGYGSAAGLGRNEFSGNGTGPGSFAGHGNFTGHDSGGPAGAPDPDSIPIRDGYGAGSRGPASFQGPTAPGGPARPAGPVSPPSPGRPGGAYDQRRGAQRGSRSDDVPVVTGVPVSRDIAPPFDVFSRVSRSGDSISNGAGGGDGDRPGSSAGAPGAGATGPGATGPQPAYGPYQGAGYGNIDVNATGYENGGTSGGEDTGLPRRVRQANLAPQLRNSAAGGNGQTGVPQARSTSLQDMRNTLSAMQRGWQQGRTQSTQRDTEGNPDGS
jgi:signal transduction histidine kinase